jgi:hypothetical protein
MLKWASMFWSATASSDSCGYTSYVTANGANDPNSNTGNTGS